MVGREPSDELKLRIKGKPIGESGWDLSLAAIFPFYLTSIRKASIP